VQLQRSDHYSPTTRMRAVFTKHSKPLLCTPLTCAHHFWYCLC